MQEWKQELDYSKAKIYRFRAAYKVSIQQFFNATSSQPFIDSRLPPQ
jgi:hypothetical protein